MKLFLIKYLRLTHAFYFAFGVIIIPVLAQWVLPSLERKSFILCTIVTFICAAFVSYIIHFVIQNLFGKFVLTILSSILATVILLIIFKFSSVIPAILGICGLSVTMQFFDGIKEAFPQIKNDQIEKWLQVVLTLFTIFISSMMVGFTMGWGHLCGEALKGEIEWEKVFHGLDYNLAITLYSLLGIALIFLSGIKHLWLVKDEGSQDSA
jgi:hypothetical protein